MSQGPSTKPRRILMSADTVGGVWTYALELARALGRYDVQVMLATMGGCMSRMQAHEAAQIGNLEVFESHFRLEWMVQPWQDVAEAGQWLLHLQESVRPDVIHLNGFVHGVLPWAAPVLVVGHACVLSWWQAVRGQPAPAEWHRYAQAVRRGLRAADMVVAPSYAMLQAVQELYGPFPHARVIPNGGVRQWFPPDRKRELILSVGRLWDEARNVAALAAVAPDLPWPVYVAGDDRHPCGKTVPLDGLRLLRKLDREQLLPWFAQAAIYVLPARYEPFGLSVLEAALSRCALVLGDIASLRENWEGAALFVPPDDTAALRRALTSLVTDRRLCADLGTRARKAALQFSPQRMAAGYMAAYSALTARWRQPGSQRAAPGQVHSGTPGETHPLSGSEHSVCAL